MNLILVTEEAFALCLSVQPRAISIDMICGYILYTICLWVVMVVERNIS